MSLPDTPSAPPNAQVPKRKKSRLTLYIGTLSANLGETRNE